MQTVIHSNVAPMAKMMGYATITPLAVKVCLDSEDTSPYVLISGTKYKTLVTSVTISTKDGSDTYKIEANR